MKIDHDEIAGFLNALGKSPSDAKTRAFFPKDHPQKAEDRGRKGGLNLATLQRWQDEGRGLYLVIGNGGDRDAEIVDVPALFVEWDDRPRDWQVTAWQELGLPEPSLQVDTGGRSIHSYWILDQPMPPDAWRKLQEGLLIHCGADQTIKNPSRVMRLPGSWYLDGVGAVVAQCRIIGGSGERFDAEMLHRVIHGESQLDGSCSPVMQSASLDAVPLVELLPREQAALARAGVGEGGRNDACFRLAAVALAVTEGAADAGVRVQGDPEALVLDFAARCAPPLSEREALTCLRSAASQPRTPEPGLQKRIDYHTRPKRDRPAREAAAAPAPAVPRERRGLDRISITCLGFDGGDYFYQSGDSGQVSKLSMAQHAQSHLLSLADLGEWEAAYPRYNQDGEIIGVSWKEAVNDLYRAQHRVGVFDPDRVRGRGAWMDDGRVVFHLGDRLIMDGAPHSVLRPPPTRFFYEQARHLDGPSDAPMDNDKAMQIRIIAEKFRWEVPASAHFLLGWIVLAPVCGALTWRPHIWVTGGAGTGKTTILKSFMRPLMGGVLQSATGGTTEAGLRGTLKSDAIPVVFDEFEQNEQKDKLIVQNILALARIASSEGGKIYKGTTSGGSNSFEIRSMFCVSSINVSLIQKADIDRFCVLGLRKDQMDRNEWIEFEKQILAVATLDAGRALIARTLRYLPEIIQNAKVLAQALGRQCGQRFGDQHGTLLAGAWSLEQDGGGLLTLQQAEEWIKQMSWEHSQADPSDADEVKCLDTILQQIVRTDGGLQVSLGEIVAAVATQKSIHNEVWGDLVPVLGRHGLRVTVKGGRCPWDSERRASETTLAIANGNAQLDGLLKATPWSGGAYKAALRRITGAFSPSSPIHFAGVGTKRCIAVPLDLPGGASEGP